MNDSESEIESIKSYKSESTMSAKSGSITPGLPLSVYERRRKAINTIENYNLGILTRHKMIEFNRNYGDKGRILELELFLKQLIAEKEAVVSELRNIPPCLDTDFPEHTILKPLVLEHELGNSKSKKQSQKRKTEKEDSEGFAFPKKTARPTPQLNKTARPTTPTKALEPVEVQNSYDNLEQDPEISIPKTNDKPPTPLPPLPIFLKIKNNYRDQLNKIMQKFPNVKSKSSGKHIKLNTDCHVEHKELIDFMDEDRDIEFYVIRPKESKPIKVVVKGLPGCTKPNEIISDLKGQGYTVSSANQLIS
ncbi:uncharacterized protein TNCV_1384881 [Trichonephila clavipes]|nr:uncharacterized protein TNCV_1384881 [Trichonephila clavipes]